MSLFRKVIFWAHLVTGVVAGIVVLIMSVTGVLLTYEKQMIRWADTRDYKAAPPSAEAARLPVETLLERVRAEQSATPTGVTFWSEKDSPAAMNFAGGRIVYVNPYTGDAFGEGSPGTRAFFRSVTDWHRWLGAKGDNRPLARAVTGACNLGFLFLVASGFYLWFPRRWSRKYLRNVTWFRRRQPARARNFNWHNVVGFWTAMPLFLIVLSGVVISYTWAGNLVYTLAGETPPPPRPPQNQPERKDESIPLDNLNPLLERAGRQVEGWKSISFQVPNAADAPVVFTIDTGSGGQPQKRAQLTLDRATGEVVRWEPFSGYSTGRRLRSILRFAHTGEVAGIAGQTVAGIASAGAALLVWTGLALAWRRFGAWRQRRQTAAPGEASDSEAESYKV